MTTDPPAAKGTSSAGVPAYGPDFLSLLKTHDASYELFLRHQDALLEKDIPLARRRLVEFEHVLLRHMHAEEKLLLPVYDAFGPHVRAPVMLFQFEHKRMVELLAQFRLSLDALEAAPGERGRAIIALIDTELKFKHLAEHHDEREERFLYPALNLATSREERTHLLGLCEAWEE